jgi:predicted TIM-barrel fold metal-dependent hydrolase
MPLPFAGRIDVHSHAILPAYRKALAEVSSGPPVFLPQWSPELALSAMDRQGIAAAVVSFAAFGVHMGDDKRAADLARQCNEDFAAIRARHPRLGAFATLPLPRADLASAEAAHALDELRLDGVAVTTDYDGKYLGHPDFHPLWEALDERATVVYVHPTAPPANETVNLNLPEWLVDYTFATTRTIMSLLFNDAIERYPNIKFIFSHGGGSVPFLDWRVSRIASLHLAGWARKRFPTPLVDRHPDLDPAEVRALLGRLYYDTALITSPGPIAALCELAEPGHVLFGSDWPYADDAIVAEELRYWDGETALPPAEQAAIERENALRLFPRIAAVAAEEVR